MEKTDPWAHRAVGMRCQSCMWYVGTMGEGSIGRCRRHAPTMTGYPAVKPDDWCGDHKIEKAYTPEERIVLRGYNATFRADSNVGIYAPGPGPVAREIDRVEKELHQLTERFELFKDGADGTLTRIDATLQRLEEEIKSL